MAPRESVMSGIPATSSRLCLAPKLYENLRQPVLRRDGWRCQRCGAMSNLEVHHRELRSQSGERPNSRTLLRVGNKCPPGEPEVLRLQAPQTGLIAIGEGQNPALTNGAAANGSPFRLSQHRTSFTGGLATGRSSPADLSNFCCFPGRTGGSPYGLGQGAVLSAWILGPAFLSRISSRRPTVLSRISPAVRLRHFLPANISFRRDTQR